MSSITNMTKKDSLFDQSGFVVVDKQYVSSSWAGDSFTFIVKFIELLNSQDKGIVQEINTEGKKEEEIEDKKENIVKPSEDDEDIFS